MMMTRASEASAFEISTCCFSEIESSPTRALGGRARPTRRSNSRAIRRIFARSTTGTPANLFVGSLPTKRFSSMLRWSITLSS